MNNNHIEIERKYLVRDESYRTLATSKVRIRQGYIHLGENGSVRVRQWDDKGYLTIKSKAVKGTFSRYEFEQEIPLKDAEELFKLCISGCIDKYRYLVPIADGLVCEVDEFLADSEGLILAEVELADENQTFEHPAFLGEEVTFDTRYFNSYLSQHPFTKW